ncbi:MAG: hypothetical protein LW860_11880 [Xanthomonadaceae bacterium]|nr:hypothetical protein [Xanthomonadaceae bacterium]
MVTSTLAVSVLSASILASGPNPEPPPLCDIAKSCTGGHYFTIGKNSLCKSLSCSDEPPPDVDIDCYGGPYAFTCEAWPRGDGLTYGWSAWPGSVAGPGWSGLPYASASCASNGPFNVLVSVTSPFGLSSHASITVECGVERVPE